MTTIRIPTPLRKFTNQETIVSVKGNTVRETLQDLINKFPDLEKQIYVDGILRSFVNIYLNQDDIRDIDGEDTPIINSDILMIVPSIAGG